ncbi:MAG TPA: DUF4347 domain-containing protein, partial [Coleofasciculaceae cyanobacterium]
MTSTPCTTLVVIDSNVNDYQSLINSVDSQAQIVVLNPVQDGVEQITTALSHFKGIESLHILSHGDAGQLQLGSSQLSWKTFAHYRHQLTTWTNALANNADILLYGCRVAAGAIGQRFVQQLSQLIGANVAASTTLTGQASLGGDWELAFRVGQISAPLAFQADAMTAYRGVLPVQVSETFANADVKEKLWLYGVSPSPTPSDQPYLTARPVQAEAAPGGLQGDIPGVAPSPDPVGSGALRLTTNKLDQSAFVVYNRAIPSTNGLTIKFDFFSYGGTSADGIAFFLIDGAASPQTAGAFGGSIGYAQKTVPTPVPGVLGGYLGIAFDEFGNFSNPTEGRIGGPGQTPNSVAVRGSQANNYNYLTGTATLPQGTIDSPGVTATGSRDLARRRVEIDLTPTGQLTVLLDLNSDGDFTDPGEQAITNFNVAAVNGALPTSFKFGFASGTGDRTNVHEIRNLVVRSGDDSNLLPNAANTTISVTPNTSVNLTGLSATDSDGEISTYTISTLPSAADGTLFLGNPATSGTAVRAGQVLQPSQITQLFFRATPNFDGGSFTYTATDNEDATDQSPATVSLTRPGTQNQPPVAQNGRVEVNPNTTVRVTGIVATDLDGTIASYTISTLPTAADGKLFLGDPAAGGTAIKAGQKLTPDQVNQLFFQPTRAFNGSTFTYTATDNLGASDATPARITLSPTNLEPDPIGSCKPGKKLKGNSTNNTIGGDRDADTLIGYAGNDNIKGRGCSDRINAGRGNDKIAGGNGSDQLKGQQGNDRITGDRGNDALEGGLGNDRLSGGRGYDQLEGGRGNDRMSGGGNSDTLKGGIGDDDLNGGIGDDDLNGNAGVDVLLGGQGRDTLKGGLGFDQLNGGKKADVLDGGRGNDVLNGAGGNDTLFGGKGNDKLYGGTQSDQLSGGAGNDILIGGRKADILTGGAGRDQFVFRSIGEAGDRITDFRVRQDKIVVKGIFDKPTYGSSDRFQAYVRLTQSGANT